MFEASHLTHKMTDYETRSNMRRADIFISASSLERNGRKAGHTETKKNQSKFVRCIATPLHFIIILQKGITFVTCLGNGLNFIQYHPNSY